jgi:3-hydroxyisobutyrate dehydrogenase
MRKEEFRVGFIGVGRMGANMALRLKDEQYEIVAVYDQKPDVSRTVAAELGCPSVPSPSNVAELANTVLTVVTDDQAMWKIFDRDASDSLLPFAKDRLFINCATLTPQVHVVLETLIQQRGGMSLEACMASSITQARNGTLYLMCGGKPEAFSQARPLLESLSSSLRYIGPSGEAAKVKALVNMVMNINTAGLAEGLGLGAALGLDVAMLREVFAQTGAASRVLETDGEDMQNRSHDCYFSAEHAAKDSGIALTLAQQVGLNLPLATAAFHQYQRLIAAGKGHLDKSGIAELTFRDRLDGR